MCLWLTRRKTVLVLSSFLSYILHENERLLKEDAILIFQKGALIWFDRLLKRHSDEKFYILEREYFTGFLYQK